MIKIRTNKVMKNGIPGRRIDSVEALPLEELPEEYFICPMYCYLAESPTYKTIIIHNTNTNRITGLSESEIYHEYEFHKRLEEIRICGEQLAQIKKEIRERWQGEEVFEI